MVATETPGIDIVHNVSGHNMRVQVPVYPNEAYAVCKGGTHKDPEYELVN